MSDPVLLALMKQVLRDYVFFGTCDDKAVDQDTACEKLEEITTMLQALPPAGLRVFLELVAEARAKEMSPKVQKFLDQVPGNFDRPAAA